MADDLGDIQKSVEKMSQAMTDQIKNIDALTKKLDALTNNMQGLSAGFIQFGQNIDASVQKIIKMQAAAAAANQMSSDDAKDIQDKKINEAIRHDKWSSDLIKARESSNERLRKHEDQRMKSRRLLEVATRSNLPMLGMITELMGTRLEALTERKALEEKMSQGIAPTEKEQEKYEMLGGNKGMMGSRMYDKIDASFEKHFGGNSKWNKMFGGHGKGAAIGMGAGALAGGMALGKMIIDSSPMFQQMLKLLNFGIMMVLRPIGDFFGFMMRPIMIMLLRKFIIPFYQQYLPIMQEMGMYIGDIIAPVLQNILIGIGGIMKIIYGLSPLALIAGQTKEYIQGGLADLATALGSTINVAETQPAIRDATAIVSAINGQTTETSSKFSLLASQLAALTNSPKNDAIRTSQAKLAQDINKWTQFMSPHLKQEGLQKIGTKTTSAQLKIAEGHMTAQEAMGWFAQEMFKGGINKMAHGGTINEPILGVGQSGQRYSFGERGSETVIPNGGSGGSNITINVYGDVDDRTMNTFEAKVLEVLNKSNSRRGI